ncbi:SRPBCC family protein [Nonomuraea sp. KC401]|uniref:SRPBCC family protein n=1 Tax=unclassified Nonomuraea TaxID=2593643 RepID=UPI0010FD046C|nr:MULTISPECIES: SRPBCC family protein [unclassified Nonomuraea]NBE99299.1 hypothetical protein [Nonomuraea sp. K271]TLF58988.1 SRPBCC family protein [Nonomuraea sp. KC401]
MKMRRETTIEELLPASAKAIWTVLTDPTRVGEWSSECRTSHWLDGATEPTAGARYIGWSQVRWISWSRACRILRADRPHQYQFETISRSHCTHWSFQLEPSGAATRAQQTFEVPRIWKVFELTVALLLPEHRDRTYSLQADLIRLGLAASRTSTGPDATDKVTP